MLCVGSDCAADERSAHRKLREALCRQEVPVVDAPCLGVCHGPVAVVEPVGSSPVVVRRVRRGRARRAIVELGRSGRLGPDATELSVDGKRGRRAIRRARRATG